jgi:hypothetical protein
MYEAHEIAESYPLESLDAESVLETARERYGDHPALTSLVSAACRCVWRKWSSDGYVAEGAEDWALEKVGECAQSSGIELIDSWALAAEKAQKEAEEDAKRTFRLMGGVLPHAD